MAISTIYTILKEIIINEIRKGRKMAIFPMGRIGLLARYIIENKYNSEGIYIDNILCQKDLNIISLKEYKKMDRDNISILLATKVVLLNETLLKDLMQARIEAKVINLLDYTCDNEAEHMARIRELCKVKKVRGYEMVRIGSMGDGGYVMVDDFKNKEIAYSIGIASEIGWDMEMAQRGFQVFCFDHTINGLPICHDQLHFIKLGLAGSSNISHRLCTLDTMLDLNNHCEKCKMILKIDIEGAEWNFLQMVSSDILERFSQITMELHDLLNTDSYEKIISGLEKLNQTHQVVWVHANCSGGARKYKSLVMPDLLEITLANRREYDFESTEYHCPTELDRPNYGNEDICLEGWGSI